MHTLYLASVFLHLLAAMTYVGGMIFLVSVAVPALRKDRDTMRTMMQTLGVRFRLVGWIALGTLIVTGLYNIVHRGYELSDIFSGTVFMGQWGRVLAHKLAMVGIILVLAVVHDFFIGPKAKDSEQARKTASILGRVTFACALAAVALAVALVRG
jgi:putative copper export protein